MINEKLRLIDYMGDICIRSKSDKDTDYWLLKITPEGELYLFDGLIQENTNFLIENECIVVL